MSDREELLSGFSLELRRGTVLLGVLSQLSAPTYGYSLVQALSGKGFPVEAGTLYPLLRRLEKQGLLQSSWETGGSKPRKYYARTPLGEEIYRALQEQWSSLCANMQELMKEESQ